MTATALTLHPGKLTYAEIRSFFFSPSTKVELAAEAEEVLHKAALSVERIVARGKPVYGVNTGFGKLAKTRIPDDKLKDLQRNLVLSHAAGIGDPMSEAVVRLILLLKANGLARGFSGVRKEVVTFLLAMLNRGVVPVIPEKGSVGASGDLAPLAHMSAVLIGEGHAFYKGEKLTGAEALKAAGLAPIVLGPKEGLALLNGTQASTALALSGLFKAERVFQAALVAGGLTLDAARGTDAPFDPRLHALRGQRGQMETAAVYRSLLEASPIRDSHREGDERVQDPYCLRCQPQVMGACLDTLRNATVTLIMEANAVSDNPIHFADTDEMISGGNFHAEPVAIAADTIAIALSEIGAISERRLAMLMDAQMSGLPPFLVQDSGLNSGFMIAQVTAAALASENKTLAHPASVDSLPTSANQEDHVSMATFAARRLEDIVENVCTIIAIECLAAVQGLDFLAPLKTSRPLSVAKDAVREEITFFAQDRLFTPDIEAMRALIAKAVMVERVKELVPLPECGALLD